MDTDKQLPLPRRTVLRATALAALTALTPVTRGQGNSAHAAPAAPPRIGPAPHPAYDTIVGLL
ncbi:hypothetical protein J7E93_28415 [Streptomyces sp. ISL-36]|uniref:hypothetical protein n=1 Tax=Streptomyces sp. ISL-36 TaxID=2819182 RepID=UPI001BE611C3|nr:hypothetical protein [Streptomyces sp. ISL-36]MBT2443950.1 hypothetical protein [Streptomyces sp. ISL-36]